MNRLFASASLALALILTTACSTTTTPAETASNQQPMTAAISGEKTKVLASLQQQFEELNNRKPGSVLLAAKMNDTLNGFCVQHAQLLDYTNLANRYYIAIGQEKTDFLSLLETKISEKGREVAGAGYQKMAAGKSITCNNDTETEMVEAVATFMDLYGKPESIQSEYDPQVVRAAWLRAAKVEANNYMTEMKASQNEEWGGPTAALGMLIENAEERAFTAADLGVSAALAKKAKEWPRG